MEKSSWLRIILTVLVGLIFLIWGAISMFQPPPESRRVKNNISFEGIVTDIDNDGGELHGFGIVRFKVVKSSTKKFDAFQDGKVYPFGIYGNYGEIYDYCSDELIGCKVFVNPKQDEFTYIKNNKVVPGGNLYLIKDKDDWTIEDDWIELIKKKTYLKISKTTTAKSGFAKWFFQCFLNGNCSK